ncbi:MAG: hypothetical protein ACRD0U_03160 [Acidimicrobiales bacterium]
MVDRGELTPTATAAVTTTDDWPAQAADTVVRLVDTIKSKTVKPANLVARGVVYGLLAAMLGLMAAVLGAVLAVRFLDVYLPEAWFGPTHTWAAHGLVGVICAILGLIAWRLRRSKAEAAR